MADRFSEGYSTYDLLAEAWEDDYKSSAAGLIEGPKQARTITLTRPDGTGWIFRYEKGGAADFIMSAANLARDPSHEFDWYDAAYVCQIARGLEDKAD